MLVLACEGPAEDKEEDSPPVTQQRMHSLLHDPTFWDYAASSNLLQVELGQLAAEQAATDKVRQLGRQAAEVHGEALAQLRMLNPGGTMVLPDSLGGADRGLVQEMRLLDVQEFDLRYREFILSTHNAQLDRYEEALAKTDDEKLRKWIEEMRLHLRQELNKLATTDSATAAKEEVQ